MNYLEILALIAASGIGGWMAWLFKDKTQSDMLHLLLSFTGAYLLGVTVLHLLPDVFSNGNNERNALYILVGFFVQLIIVQLTRGIEHGHLHLHEKVSTGYVLGVLFGLSIHAFMEGIPLSSVGDAAKTHGQSLYYAILLHKIPETFALATLLFFSSKKTLIPICLISLFALMTPLGIFIGRVLEHLEGENAWLIAIVVGTFIHISTTIIFEASGKAHKISLYKFLAIILGASISLLSLSF